MLPWLLQDLGWDVIKISRRTQAEHISRPTQVVPASPGLTSALRSDRQYNLITAALQRETSVNTSPFYLLIHLDK